MVPPPGAQVSPDGRWIWNGVQWVPNQQPVAAPYGKPWLRPYESARFRALFVVVFLAVNAGALVVGIALDLGLIAIGGNLDNPNQAGVIAVGLVALAFLALYYGSLVPAIVLFSMWLHRVVRNMPALGTPDPRWSAAGAVGRCFVPFLNFVHPLLSVTDAWRGSDERYRWTPLETRLSLGTPNLIALWWASWLAGRVLTTFTARMTNSNDPGTVVAGAGIDIFGTVLTIGAAVLAILVVRRLTARQDNKYQLIASGALN